MDTDHNLLFAVLALQVDLIDLQRFADVCAGWAVRKQVPLPEILIERGYITAADRQDVERLLERKLKKYGGNARASMSEVAGSAAREALRSSHDPEVLAVVEGLTFSPAAADAPPAGPSAVPAGRYSWHAVHAEGNLGRIWRAVDGDLNREVALKVIKPALAHHAEARRRLLAEAQVTGQLEHPNIVPVYELGRRPEDDQPFYVMRLIRGQTLEAAIAEYHGAREGQPDVGQRRRLLQAFVRVCDAVAYAHSRGVLHRDLKPANIMLGTFGEVYLLDWGLAKVRGQPADAETAAVVTLIGDAAGQSTVVGRKGTPAYMSPEQADRREDLVNERTDVYGLGAVLFELLTGRPPFDGKDTDQVLQAILKGDTPSARQVGRSVPPALDRICSQALAKDQALRHATAADLGGDVQRWLDEEPVAAYRAAVEYFEGLVRGHPRLRSYREGLARNLVHLGLVLQGMDRKEEAETAYRQAIDHYETLVGEHAGVVRYRADLAACRLYRHGVLRALDRKAEAEEVHRQALGDYDRLVRIGAAGDYRGHLMSALSLLGHSPAEVQRRLDELPAEAEELIDERQPGPVPEGSGAAAPRSDCAREVLFAVLAVQRVFIDIENLKFALQRWADHSEMPLGRFLVEQNTLTEEEWAQLDEAVEQRFGRAIPAPGEESLPPPDEPPPGPVESVMPSGEASPGDQTVVGPPVWATLPPEAYEGSPPLGATGTSPRYRILRLQAQGGLGVVYVAHDEALNREVALKTIREQHANQPHVRARFLREAEITARLEHPGIVPIYSLGQYEDTRPFYAMRFIRGDTFQEAISRFHHQPRSPAERALFLRHLLTRFLTLCNTVSYAHSRGVIHRDIKPSNILIGAFGEALLLDWGLAKIIGHSETSEAVSVEDLPLQPTNPLVTRAGQAIGTPSYMSPEQAAGHGDRIGPESDIYSLGVMLYHLLTGKLPFPGTDVETVLHLVRAGDFAPPHQVTPGVPKVLEAICLKAMAHRPEGRYRTASDLASDVDRWLADEPVSALSESFRHRLNRWLRKHRLLTWALTVALVSAIVSFALVALLALL